MTGDGLEQELAQALRRVLEREVARLVERNVPVLPQLRSPVLNDQDVPGGEFLDPVVDGAGGGNVAEGEILAKGREVEVRTAGEAPTRAVSSDANRSSAPRSV